ncbi:MAG: hypothetical protein A2W00_04470 [Candidatus Eisenbacteria bacterium RBG_16_71_46]|nr:MAG: hypothetical protein A2V59_06805 [Armatimonadetes bacterium RBG_19FT_COMBO_69_19]OGF05206.1 MAG: hypothetical protein A2W00_04470 [Candidatus Eisenbacteria bacterium RBG_16_71_46]
MPLTPGGPGSFGSADPASGGPSAPEPITLSETATIRRKTLTADGLGTHSLVWNDAGEVACALDKTTRRAEVVQAGELKSLTVWTCYFKLDGDVRPADRVVIGGRTYEVTETDAGRTGATVLTATLVRVSGVG